MRDFKESSQLLASLSPFLAGFFARKALGHFLPQIFYLTVVVNQIRKRYFLVQDQPGHAAYHYHGSLMLFG